MGLSFPTYPLSKKYTDETVAGGGAIKGKNLVVTSIEAISGGKRINVQWTLDNGTVLTDHVDLENGKDGKGIKSVAINAEEHLIITYTDNTTSDAGKIEIQSAVDSVNGETGDVVLVLTDIVNVGSNLTYNSTTKTLSADAQAQVQADWEQSDNTQADYIKNKPTLGTASEKDAINTVLAGSTSLPTGDAVKTAIDEAVSGAYHHAGTKTVAELTSALLVEANNGNVYNMTDSGVTTADFIEGAGKPIAIGDNVGVAKVGNDYKFDLLSGFVDTSNFVNKSSTSGLIKNDGTIDTTDYADKSEMSITDGTGADLGTSTIQLKSGTSKKVLTEHQNVTGKADKVQNATNNHIALLDGLGNLKDGGKAITDLIPNGGTTGQVLAKHSNTDGDVEWKDMSASGGHTIENSAGTALTQRDTLQFKGGLSVSDDSTNEVTVVDTSALANKTDLTAIILTGTTNTSGGTITAGTWFYLNGKLCVAKVDIANDATFTLNTNYEEKTIGQILYELTNSSVATLYEGQTYTLGSGAHTNGTASNQAICLNIDSTTNKALMVSKGILRQGGTTSQNSTEQSSALAEYFGNLSSAISDVYYPRIDNGATSGKSATTTTIFWKGSWISTYDSTVRQAMLTHINNYAELGASADQNRDQKVALLASYYSGGTADDIQWTLNDSNQFYNGWNTYYTKASCPSFVIDLTMIEQSNGIITIKS